MNPLRFFLPATLSLFLLTFLSSCGGSSEDAHADGSGDHHDDKEDSLLDLLEHGDGNAPDPHAASAHETAGDHDANASVDILTHNDLSPEPSIDDLHSLLHGTPSVSVGETPGATDEADAANDALLSPEDALPALSSDESEQALLEMENSQRSLKTQINVLKKTIAEKDGKIATLTRFNEQLRTENSRLRRSGPTGDADAPVSGDIQGLQSQITGLKNSLALQLKANLTLREHNKALLEKLGGARPSNGAGDQGPTGTDIPPVVAPDGHSGKLPPLTGGGETVVEEPPAANTGSSSAAGSLAFNAVVTASNGKIKEAFYTEFFIAKSSLREILEAGDIHLDKDKYPGVSSHAELWARCRKDPFRFPNLQKQIRETLLNHVENNGGRRIRTNIDGRSEDIKDVAAERHHVIGTATLGKVGVTWDVPVTISPGKHTSLSLTLANASWSL